MQEQNVRLNDVMHVIKISEDQLFYRTLCCAARLRYAPRELCCARARGVMQPRAFIASPVSGVKKNLYVARGRARVARARVARARVARARVARARVARARASASTGKIRFIRKLHSSNMGDAGEGADLIIL